MNTVISWRHCYQIVMPKAQPQIWYVGIENKVWSTHEYYSVSAHTWAVLFIEKLISIGLYGKPSVCKHLGNMMSHTVCFLEFSCLFIRCINLKKCKRKRELISFTSDQSVCSSGLIAFILPSSFTCPKVKNLVLCHLWLQLYHKYIPHQKPENEVECSSLFRHLSTIHLENNNTQTQKPT